MNNGWLLLRTLLLSTSRRNILRFSADKKKRRRIIGRLSLFLAAAPSKVPRLCQRPSLSYMTSASRLLPAESAQRS